MRNWRRWSRSCSRRRCDNYLHYYPMQEVDMLTQSVNLGPCVLSCMTSLVTRRGKLLDGRLREGVVLWSQIGLLSIVSSQALRR